MKQSLDPYWHMARVAARIWLKAQKRPLNARDRRLARRFAAEKGVTDRLIEQGVAYWTASHRLDAAGNRVERVCHVVGA